MRTRTVRPSRSILGPVARPARILPTSASSIAWAATFECSLDGAPFTPCTSPHTIELLTVGDHTFAVRAVNGSTTGAPVTRNFTLLGSQAITSSGPLTTVAITGDLNCSVNHTGDAAGEFFAETACGTLVAVGGTLFGPSDIPSGESATPRTAFTPVSQSAVSGAGTLADPFTILTVVDLGTTGLRLTETDSYVVGEESYRTEIQIANGGAASQDLNLYRAGDCFLQDSDVGFGSVEPATGAVACTTGITPGSRIEQWFPISPGSHYYEADFDEVWTRIGAQLPFPDTCRCSESVDNGAGLSWGATIPAGESINRSHLTTFSPLGRFPLATTKTADSASVGPGSANGYTITVSNPNATEVSLSSITDALPAGFTYTTGSTTGATTADPSTSGQVLTWAGPIAVPAASGDVPGTVSLHFGVTASTTAGDYFNNAEAQSADYTVVPTGDTARVTVSQSMQEVTIDTVSDPLLGPGESSTDVTWHATENGPYSVRLGGSDCASGTELASGEYSTAPATQTTNVLASDLAEGANTIRVCVTTGPATRRPL